MEIDVIEDGVIRLKKVFNSIALETEEGEKIVICMRDGGFEIGVDQRQGNDYTWHSIKNGKIKPLNKDEPCIKN